ncbi:MAG TPA: helix-turn-helix domain-containing protein [Marinobacter sp.]|nr:helix-turn-helix domain-containing protein [Marinobacter sp.]
MKGLDIVRALNQSPNGASSIKYLSDTTGLHRTTVKRILETLIDEGYIKADRVTNYYRLTHKVLSLSYGFRDSVRVVDIAWPKMMAFTKEFVWPCSLLTLEGLEMVTRASTHAYSVFSFHTGMPGRKLPILDTAAGKAYISYCSEAERETLLSLLIKSDGNAVKKAEQVVNQTQELGYGVNRGEWEKEPRFGGISVPVIVNDSIVACINAIFLNHAVSDEDIGKIAGRLNALSRDIREEASLSGCDDFS